MDFTTAKWVSAVSWVSLVAMAGAAATTGVRPPDGPEGAVSRAVTALDAGDAAGVRRCVVGENADETLLLPAFAEAAAAAGRFGRAMTDAFGEHAAGLYGVARRANAGAASGPAAAAGPNTAGPNAAGPNTGRAAVTLAAGGPPVTVVRSLGEWKLTFAGAVAVCRVRGVDLSVPPDEPLRRYTETAAAIDAVTGDLRAGRITLPAAAADAARQAVENARRGAAAQ